MIHTQLTADLPRQLPAPAGIVQRLVDWALDRGDAEPREGDEALQAMLLDNLTVFEQLLGAFADAGFDDVVAVVVDGKPAYVDLDEKIGDLHDALTGVVKSRAVADGFAVMRTTLCTVTAGLRVLAELRCHARTPDGQEQVVVRVSGRIDDFDPRHDEGPREYAARVREYVRDPKAIVQHRQRVAELATKLSAAIEARLSGAKVSGAPTVVRVIAPGLRQVGRFRHLGFGAQRRTTVYSSLPTYERLGPYDDPLTHHYYSPYLDLFHWITLGEVLSGHWGEPWVEVVHASGRLLLTGDRGSTYDPGQLEVARDVVRVNPHGRLVVDGSVPEAPELIDPVEAGSHHTPGWAGEDWAEEDG